MLGTARMVDLAVFDKRQKAEFDSIMVVDRRSGLAKAIEPKEAIPYRAGNIEVIFHCVKPEA